MTTDTEDIVYRLRKRSEIRRQIKDRKSVQEGKPDRICLLLGEAADKIESLRWMLEYTGGQLKYKVNDTYV